MIRIDTTIKVINDDGSTISAPVVVHIDVTSLGAKQQTLLYTISSAIYNKDHVINRGKKLSKSSKPWWKIW